MSRTGGSYELHDRTLRVLFTIEGGTAFVELIDLLSGAVWGPTQAFTLDIYSIVLRRTTDIDRLESRLEQGDGWVSVTQCCDNIVHSASVTAVFSVDHGELLVRIPSSDIREERRELSLLYGVNLLPSLLYVHSDTDGHLVLPYRNGALCYPKLHARTTDRFLIYGEQPNWEIMPMLPCTGAVRRTFSSALLAIVESGDCDAQCRVDIDGIGGGETGFSLRYRYTEIDPVDPIDRVVRFAPLRGDEANYAGMGRRMRRFIKGKSAIGSLDERAKDNSDIDYAANSFVLKIIHACKEIGSVTGDGELRILTTFDDAAKQLETIKAAGIDRVYVQLTGWNSEGHDGRYPTRFPVAPELGGEEAFRRLIKIGRNLGFQMQVHDNYIDLMKRSPDFDSDYCVGGEHGGPLKRGCWAGGINYAGWPLAYPSEMLEGEMDKVKELGPSGVYYIDAIGMPLEVSYNPKHGERRYRRACAEGIQRILRSGRATFGSVGCENGYLYCAIEADYIGSPFLESQSKPSSALVDTPVPLWFMAIKGHAFCILNDTYEAAIDPDSGSSTTAMTVRMLTMAELGLLPRNEIAGSLGDWGYPLEPVLDAMKIEYDLVVSRLSGIGAAELVNHQIISGSPLSGDHLTHSTFSNGIVTECDYGHGRLTVNGVDYSLSTLLKKKPKLANPSHEHLAGIMPSDPQVSL